MFCSGQSKVAARVWRRAFGIAALSFATSFGALGLALSIEACGSGETSGARVLLDTRVELAPNAQSFTTARGWDVTLSRVLISTGPFYYFDGAPPTVRLERRSPRERWPWLFETLGSSQAFAHLGTTRRVKRSVRCWIPGASTCWRAPRICPRVTASPASIVRRASASRRRRRGPMASAMEGHAAVAEGVVQRPGEPPLRFVATAELADIERSAANGYIDGCQFEELDIEQGGRVTVRVNPKVWFDLVDFAELAPATDDVPVPFPADSQPKIAFALGLAQLSAYKFTFSAP